MGRARSAIRASAWVLVAVGVAAPLVRRRVRAPALAIQLAAFGAPLGLSVALRRSRTRDVAVCALHMWAYVLAYKSPHDDEQAQAERVHVDYPIALDRALGLGELPTVRLQRALASSGEWRALDRVLVWTHWSWMLAPNAALAYILWRNPRRFPRAAALTYAVFDLGACVYWLAPTAPPWYAAELSAREPRGEPRDGEQGELLGEPRGERGGGELVVRRMMAEYGEFFWQDGWTRLYSVFGGNPLAAMPSLHFATSLMSAHLLAEHGRLEGALALLYTLTLGFALVYLGEHYVVDLLAGVALVEAVRRGAPRAGPPIGRLGRAVGTLEAIAHESG